MSAVPEVLLRALSVLALALAVRIAVDRWLDVPYSVLLILVGVAVSALPIDIGIRLSGDVIVAVVLPVVLFEGATSLDREALREDWLVLLTLIVPGVPLAVVLVGAASSVAFGLPLLVALLFAAIVVPTDPVAVLSLFEELEAPDHLTVIVESESLFNDGVAIVIVNVLLAILAERSTAPGGSDVAGTLVAELAVVGVGGFLIGSAIGYGTTLFIRRIPERMAVLLVTVLIAYGSFAIAEELLGVSGILATVGAGLFTDPGAHGGVGVDRDALAFVRDTWAGGTFLLSTMLYVLIGAQVSIARLLEYLPFVVVAAVLVVLVRGIVVYALVAGLNVATGAAIPRSYQHLLVWGGLHTVVPIALALGLPPGVAHREFIQAVVFGVAILGAIVQGFLMPSILRRSGVADRASRVGRVDGAA